MNAQDVFESVFVPARGTTSSPAEYLPYRVARRLLVERAAAFPCGSRALLRASGWNREDPGAVPAGWTSLRGGRIPRTFVSALDIDAALVVALDADAAEWARALECHCTARAIDPSLLQVGPNSLEILGNSPRAPEQKAGGADWGSDSIERRARLTIRPTARGLS